MSSSRVRLVVFTLGIALTVVWCLSFFGNVLSGDRTFAFRDTGHYYYRLFAWVNDEIQAGRVPLWNPHENNGVPQVADASSSVFYPGKLLFLLPGVDYTLLFNAYIVLHYLLAAAGIALLAHRWQMPPLAAAVSLVCYVSCGALISQTCNVVFLVGAAWLPWACVALTWLRRKPWIGMLGLATVLSMMVLGGDPQMAYHVMLIGLLMIACDRRGHQANRARQPYQTFDTYRSPYRARGWSRSISEHIKTRIDSRLLFLGAAAFLAIALSAIQVLPSAVWSRDSSRSMYTRPRSIYEAVAFVSADEQPVEGGSDKWYAASQGLIGEPVEGTHHDHIYQFSVPPWTVPEIFWPNFGGRIYPVHRRWIDEVGSAERVWNPSIYLGCIPCLLALSVWSLRGKSSRQRTLSWLLLLSLLASFGWYGLGWLLREVLWMTSGTPPQAVQMGSPTGGVYWMFVTLLPSYAQFRYPAKWLIISAFAVAMLAGYAISRYSDERSATSTRRLQRLSCVLAAVTVLTLIVSWLAQPWLTTSFFDRPADQLFGPFDASGALLDTRLSLVQTLASLVLGGAIFVGWRRLQQPLQRAGLGMGLVLLIGADFLIANRWVVATAPKEAWENYSPEVLAALPEAKQVTDDASDSATTGLARVYRANLYDWLPASFQTTSSPHRMEEIVRWDTATLFPKHHLSIPVTLVESYGSIAAADQEVLMEIARQQSDFDSDDGSPELPPRVLAMLGTDLAIAPQPLYSSDEQWSDWQKLSEAEDAWLGRFHEAPPRVWMTNQFEKTRPPRRGSLADLQRVVTESLDTGHDWLDDDHAQPVIVYSNDARRISSLDANCQVRTCRMIDYSSQEILIEVDTVGTQLLVVNEYYRPGWHATITSQASDEEARVAPVIRVNQVMRGVVVPGGKHLVKLYYDPAEFRWGCWISLASWVLLACGIVGGFAWTRVQSMRDEHRRLTRGERRQVRSDN